MEFLLTIFFFLLIVGFLVFVHELGHFLAAKISGIWVKEFAIGFGPSLIKKKYGETTYKLNLLPLGGFVQLEGENDDKIEHGFRSKPFYVKAFVLNAGVIMNFITATVFLFITLEKEDYNIPVPNIVDYNFHNTESVNSYFPIRILDTEEEWGWENVEDDKDLVEINHENIGSYENFVDLVEKYRGQTVPFTYFDLLTYETSEDDVTVGGVFHGSYYPITLTDVLDEGRSKDQLSDGEIIVAINGQLLESSDEFFELLAENQGEVVEMTFIDEETFETSTREIEVFERNDKGAILDVTVSYGSGINVAYDERTEWQTYFVNYKNSILSAPVLTFDMSVYQLKGISNLVSEAISSGDYSEVSKAVGGPVALGDSVNEVVEYQIYDLFFFLTGLISLSLAIFNILPIPALDGGQIMIAFIETVRRKRLSDSIVNKINLAGFVFIVLLSILITVKDIKQLNVLESLKNLVEGIFGR